jgi:hypothetical protein
MRTNHEPTGEILGVAALLTRARGQTGSDQLWSLAVISQALRDLPVPSRSLDRVDRQLHAHIADRRDGAALTVPPALIDTLAALADRVK